MEGGGDGEIENTQKKQVCSTLGDRRAKEKKQKKGREMLGVRGVRKVTWGAQGNLHWEAKILEQRPQG